ncbi:SMP-30/gluconolactonase/LRE family protein [Pararhizobium sp. PWRC1-1]|uniref:SMP-30/gluconolactonase/LRE family protein n=1 Tax=Pararhizobium sp. PWRC1-1 TaxID=2804566 RepID=UPI003CED5BA5
MLKTSLNQVLHGDLSQPEGPVVQRDGSLVVVEMSEERACLTGFDLEGNRVEIVRPGGRPTGLAVDGDGCFWVAGGAENSLVKLSPRGDLLLSIFGDEQGPFLFPNDLAFGPDGLLYMTDSGMKPDEFIKGFVIRSDFATASYDGRVFQIEPKSGKVLKRVAGGLLFTNGIAFDAAGVLHYAETLTGKIFRHEDGRSPELFSQTPAMAINTFWGPDGMAFGASGRLYCANYGAAHVSVFAPDGEPLEPLPTNGNRPTNVVFGNNPGELLVTEVEHGCVEIVEVGESGLPLIRPKLGLYA